MSGYFNGIHTFYNIFLSGGGGGVVAGGRGIGGGVGMVRGEEGVFFV